MPFAVWVVDLALREGSGEERAVFRDREFHHRLFPPLHLVLLSLFPFTLSSPLLGGGWGLLSHASRLAEKSLCKTQRTLEGNTPVGSVCPFSSVPKTDRQRLRDAISESKQ